MDGSSVMGRWIGPYSIFLYANMYLCCQYSLHSMHWYLSEREREAYLGIFGFYNITILMQFALWRSSQHCPNEIEHCCTSAFYYVVFWNILVVAFFLAPKILFIWKNVGNQRGHFIVSFFCHQATTNNILMVKYVVFISFCT